MASKILITGSSGRIGKAAVNELKTRGYALRGFDRVASAGVDEMVIGNLTDPDALNRAMSGIDVLIHLAATPDDADFMSELLPNNIIGLYQLLEAARRAGVRRLILASTGQVNWWQRFRGRLPVQVDDPPSPRYWYAASKMFLESIGRGYAETHEMNVLIVRLGFCPRTPEQVQEIENSDWAQDVYLSPRDAGLFFACAVQSGLPQRFAIVFATSKPVARHYYDLEPAKRLAGFEPREQWPQGAETIVNEH